MPLDNLGKLVEGGIPQATVVLLSGSPGTGKSSLALQLLADHTTRGGHGVAVTTEASPAQLAQRAGLFGVALQQGAERLAFLDCYSWRTGKPSTGPGIKAVTNLNDLSSLSIELSAALDAARGPLVLFDTPSTLTLHAPSATILKLLEVSFAKVKSAGGSMLVPIEKEMHDEAFVATLAAMCDGVLDFRLIEENDDLVRQMRVRSMRNAASVSSKWVRLAFSKAGIELEPAAAKAVA